MTGQILTLTNLFPTAARPHHGRFVQDRMRRVATHSGMEWQVVCPIPRVPRPFRRAADRALAKVPAREEVEGVIVHNVHYFHLPGLSLRKQAARIAVACRPLVAQLSRGVATVVDAHYVYPDGVAAMWVAAELGLPGVVTARGTDVNVVAETAAVRTQVRAAMATANALFAVSGALQQQFDAILGVLGRVQLARNGVDLEAFRPCHDAAEQAAIRAGLGLPAGRRLVLGVGRLIESKGFHHAAAALRDLSGDSALVLVGDGPQRARIAALLPPDRLVLLGVRPRAEVAAAYRACDLLVLPTYREGWPNVVTEALASGLPVVASSVGGIPEICQDDRVTSLVPPGDEPALRRAIERFLGSPPDPAQVRALAARYSWSETVEMLSNLFQELAR